MNRILAIDYGYSKVGIAIGDNVTKVAVPFAVLENNKDLLDDIKNICQIELVNKIIIGVPFNLRHEKSPQFLKTQDFIKGLKSKIQNCEIIEENEVMTTKMAQKLTGDTRKEDDVAAMLILQSYLDSHD